jgi:hypothetical protein
MTDSERKQHLFGICENDFPNGFLNFLKALPRDNLQRLKSLALYRALTLESDGWGAHEQAPLPNKKTPSL